MNADWPRWTKASFALYFSGLIAGLDISFAPENQPKKTISADTSWVEMRLDGPNVLGITSDYYTLQCIVEFMVHVAIDPASLFDPELISGSIQSFCYACIPLKKIGQPSDTGEIIDYFTQKGKIRATQIGNKNPTDNFAQILIEAPYEIQLTP